MRLSAPAASSVIPVRTTLCPGAAAYPDGLTGGEARTSLGFRRPMVGGLRPHLAAGADNPWIARVPSTQAQPDGCFAKMIFKSSSKVSAAVTPAPR